VSYGSDGAQTALDRQPVETIAVVLGFHTLDSATLAPFIAGLLIPRSERYGDGWLRGPVIRQNGASADGYGQDQDRPTAPAALVLPEAAAEPLVEPLPKTSERLTEEASRLPGYARPSRAA